MNTIPGLTVDLYINDIPRITNLEYADITQYLPTRPGLRNLKLYDSNTKQLLYEEKEADIIVGQLVTQLIYGSVSDFKFIRVIDDINETIMPDETKIRFYNATDYSISFTLYSPTNPVSMILDSGNGSRYIEINAGSYPLELLLPNGRSKTISISFKLGRIYTVYIINSISPDNPGYNELNIPQIILVVDGNTLFGKCIFP